MYIACFRNEIGNKPDNQYNLFGLLLYFLFPVPCAIFSNPLQFSLLISPNCSQCLVNLLALVCIYSHFPLSFVNHCMWMVCVPVLCVSCGSRFLSCFCFCLPSHLFQPCTTWQYIIPKVTNVYSVLYVIGYLFYGVTLN